jgi:hypothetical protein
MIRLQKCRFQMLCIRDGAPLDGIEPLTVNCVTLVPTNAYSTLVILVLLLEFALDFCSMHEMSHRCCLLGL